MATTGDRMPASAAPAASAVPAKILSAAPLLEQVATAMGWLDDRARLAWANAALLAQLGRSRLPPHGLDLEGSIEDAGRVQAALDTLGAQLDDADPFPFPSRGPTDDGPWAA